MKKEKENVIVENAVVTTENSKALETQNEYNPFATPSNDDIGYINGMPRQWRADCSASGSYKIGESTNGLEEMEMEILFFLDFPETQFFPEKYRPENWVCLYFVDKDNQFSTMLIKGRSRENFIELTRSIQAEKKAIATKIVVASMKEKSNEKWKFKVCTFKAKDNSIDRISVLQDFWVNQDNGKGLYSHFVSDIFKKAPVINGEQNPVFSNKVEDVEAVAVN